MRCTTADTEKCENLKLIDLESIKHLDEEWTQESLGFIDKMKGS